MAANLRKSQCTPRRATTDDKTIKEIMTRIEYLWRELLLQNTNELDSLSNIKDSEEIYATYYDLLIAYGSYLAGIEQASIDKEDCFYRLRSLAEATLPVVQNLNIKAYKRYCEEYDRAFEGLTDRHVLHRDLNDWAVCNSLTKRFEQLIRRAKESELVSRSVKNDADDLLFQLKHASKEYRNRIFATQALHRQLGFVDRDMQRVNENLAPLLDARTAQRDQAETEGRATSNASLNEPEELGMAHQHVRSQCRLVDLEGTALPGTRVLQTAAEDGREPTERKTISAPVILDEEEATEFDYFAKRPSPLHAIGQHAIADAVLSASETAVIHKSISLGNVAMIVQAATDVVASKQQGDTGFTATQSADTAQEAAVTVTGIYELKAVNVTKEPTVDQHPELATAEEADATGEAIEAAFLALRDKVVGCVRAISEYAPRG